MPFGLRMIDAPHVELDNEIVLEHLLWRHRITQVILGQRNANSTSCLYNKSSTVLTLPNTKPMARVSSHVTLEHYVCAGQLQRPRGASNDVDNNHVIRTKLGVDNRKASVELVACDRQLDIDAIRHIRLIECAIVLGSVDILPFACAICGTDQEKQGRHRERHDVTCMPKCRTCIRTVTISFCSRSLRSTLLKVARQIT